jgi:hypothetical protein
MQRIKRQQSCKIRTYDKGEGVEFVRCLICSKQLRVISGRHLSTHGTDRETYIQEYQLSLDQLCSKSFRVNHSSRSDYCPHNNREWIAAMKAVYKQHGNVYAGFLQKHDRNLYDEGLWLNGGDWDAALCVLGFTPERMRLRTYWQSERVLNEIRLLRENGIPLYPKYVLKHCAALFGAARVIYGSWRNALIAAGIEVPDSPHDGRRGVARALRDALEQRQENDVSEKLKLHAAYYFGSMEKAKAALKTDRRLSAGWNKTKIIAAIHKRHRSGQALGYAAARRDNPALVSAAEAYFGSWGNALYAAGIDPNLYLRYKWRLRTMPAKRDRLSYGNVFKPAGVGAVTAI